MKSKCQFAKMHSAYIATTSKSTTHTSGTKQNQPNHHDHHPPPFICCCDDGSLHPIRYVCPFRMCVCVFYRYVVCCDIDVRFCPSNRYCYFDQFCRVNTVEGSTLFTHSPTASLARQVVSARLVMSSIHRAAGMLAVCWFCASVREFI